MRTNYKRLGDYIEQVNVRNSELRDIPLVGLSLNKVFIPSIANTIGTNMATYKIIKRNQFAYGPVTSRNGEKITIALFKDYDEALISQAYLPFKIVKTDKLLPDYLMMWFSRPEFDRYTRYKSHGSARETFDWTEMCDVLLPVPPIEEQEKIVAEYQAIENKIKVNQQICEKLEATAQAIYKEWFVEFNFPFDFAQGKPDKNGKPYKDNGGKMVWNAELEKEVPEGWGVSSLEDICENFDYKRIPLSKDVREKRRGIYPYYGAASLMDYVDDYIFEGTYILLGEDGTVITDKGTPVLQYVWGKFWVNNHAHVLKGKNGFDENILYVFLKNLNVSEIITGGVQAKINQQNLNNLRLLIPNISILELFKKEILYSFETMKNYKTQNQQLTQLKSLLLARTVK